MKNGKTSLQKRISRRNFLGRTFTAAAGLGISGKNNLFGNNLPNEPEEDKIKEYRTLGRTGFKCSDISFGSSGVTDPVFMKAVLDSGINYIDTAESYVRGQVERTIGLAMKDRDRKSVFISISANGVI